MKRLKIIHYILTFTLSLLAFAASADGVTGSVFEKQKDGKKLPLAGVNVYWAGTTKGTFTDTGGKFSISRQGITDPKLVFSLLGYGKDTLAVNSDKAKLEVELRSNETELGEVEITGKQDNTFVSKLNARATTVITTGELQRAACCNLAESFETNASVDVSYSDAISGARQIQLLGLSGIYSQIMTENVPLIRGLATPFGLNYIPGSWMESIQVAKGTSSVVQGYESVTGQINVEYKKPETAPKFFLNLFGNSNLRFEGNADAAFKINDKLSTSVLMCTARISGTSSTGTETGSWTFRR
jgi:outer membrane receptor for ferrienterochelin and colicins